MFPVAVIAPVTAIPPFAVIAPVTVKAVNVPTDVNEDAVTPDANVAPDRVPAAAVTVIAAEPSKFTPLIALAVANVVAVDALPVNAPVNPVEVTDDKPAIVVADEPNEIAVEPIVIELLVKELFPILLNVFEAPLIVLLVSVCVPVVVANGNSEPAAPAFQKSPVGVITAFVLLGFVVFLYASIVL